jgi:hypothetical protein
MNKSPSSNKGQSSIYTRRSFSPTEYAKPLFATVEHSVVSKGDIPKPLVTINFRQMAKDAAKMQEYIANGGKQGESSESKLIKPSGLFNNRGVGQR